SHCQALLKRIAECNVGDRPGRIEPRELKRRRHGYKLMQEPREKLRAHLARRN
ncbi:MAG TPA: IS4 family transposase, partial [Pirellulales bacterium]|nr:IS4 family transposase [Pirellulales bacterium]